MAERQETILEIKDLKVYYDSAEAIKGVNLAMKDGQLISLLGANGAGKTTIMRAISGLKRCSGEIWFKGERIDNSVPPKIVKLGIGYVPEGKELFPYMSVWENLILGAYLREDSQAIERDLYSVYDYFPVLKKRQKQMAGSLSGGEQQMLAIGRALMSKPKLLLLDEPTIGLSPILCEEICEIIKTICTREKTSVLLVEQNAMLALEYSQYSYILEDGKVGIEGESIQLLTDERVRITYLGI